MAHRSKLVAVGTVSLLGLLCAREVKAQQNSNRPPKPGVKTPGIQREITKITPVKQFEAEGNPDWLTVGPDAMWFSNRGKRAVFRIDPATNTMSVSASVGPRPCSGSVYAFDSLWVPDCEEKTLSRVDAKTNKVTATIPVGPAASEGGVTASGDSVWILSDKQGVLSRVDPGTNKVVAEITTPPGCYDTAFGFDSVWVTCTETNEVLRLNPANNLVEKRIPVGKGPRFLAVGEGAVWALNEGDGTLSRVNPTDNKLEATIDVGLPGGGDVAVGEGAVWISAFDFPITRIDPSTNKVTHQFSGPGGDAIRAAFGSVWLINIRQKVVWRVDPKRF